MKQFKIIAVAIALALSGGLIGKALHAAGFNYFVESDGRYTVQLIGEIKDGDSVKLEKILERYPEVDLVSMISSGGLAAEGYKLASVLSKHNMNVRVPDGFVCASACAAAFIGGTNYDIDGALTFHVSWIPGEAPMNTDINDVFKWGQGAGTRDMYHIMANGFAAQMAFIITNYTTKDRFLTFFSEKDLNTFYVRSDTDKIYEYLSGPVEVDRDWLDRHVLDTDTIYAYLGYERR